MAAYEPNRNRERAGNLQAMPGFSCLMDWKNRYSDWELAAWFKHSPGLFILPHLHGNTSVNHFSEVRLFSKFGPWSSNSNHITWKLWEVQNLGFLPRASWMRNSRLRSSICDSSESPGWFQWWPKFRVLNTVVRIVTFGLSSNDSPAAY